MATALAAVPAAQLSPLAPLDTPPLALTELHQLVLKRLFAVGDRGMKQQDLFDRLPKKRTATLITTMRELHAAGYVLKQQSGRQTTTWALLWVITPEGRMEHHQWSVIEGHGQPHLSQLK